MQILPEGGDSSDPECDPFRVGGEDDSDGIPDNEVIA